MVFLIDPLVVYNISETDDNIAKIFLKHKTQKVGSISSRGLRYKQLANAICFWSCMHAE
jgi:hypothetical protein